MDLSPKKMVLTGAAALGIVLGAAGVTAAATDTTSTTPTGVSTSGYSGAQTSIDKPEANDTPDANDVADANEANDQPDAVASTTTPSAPSSQG